MAEKYGEVPKRFTEKWFEYIWDYYKWHIIAVAAVIILAVITVCQIRSTPRYDVTLTAAGKYIFSDSEISAITEKINLLSEDINGDGEVTSEVYSLLYTGDETTDTAYSTKLALQLQADDMLLYLMDKERFDEIIADSYGDETFTPLDEWYDGNAAEEDIYYSNGIAYGVKISSGGSLSQMDTDMYLALRKNYRHTEKTQTLYDNCKRIASEIMK